MSDQSAINTLTTLQEQPLQNQYEDPPPSYKAFDEGSTLESQVRTPPQALVTGERGGPEEVATPSTPTTTPNEIPPVSPAYSISAFIGTGLLAYSIACATFAERARRSHGTAEFWCHSKHGSNLTTLLTLVFFGLLFRILTFSEVVHKGCPANHGYMIPMAAFVTVLIMMGIKSNVCER